MEAFAGGGAVGLLEVEGNEDAEVGVVEWWTAMAFEGVLAGGGRGMIDRSYADVRGLTDGRALGVGGKIEAD